jgi:hypothetical protein
LLRRRSARALVVGGLTLTLAQTLATSGAVAVDPSASTPSAATTAAAAGGEVLRPNLVVLQAKDIYIQRYGSERRVRFESGLGSAGVGPVEVRPNRARACPPGQHHATQIMYRDADGNGSYDRGVDTGLARRSAGCMVFHRFHDHWHFEAASRYTLFRVDNPRNAKVAQRKMSFCLRDSEPLPARFNTPAGPEHYGACSRHSPQGISVGWVDVYQSFLAGQAIKLPQRMGDGVYCLHIKVDPRNTLAESNERDNTSVRTFAIRGDKVNYRKNNRRCQRLTR